LFVKTGFPSVRLPNFKHHNWLS